MNNLKVKTGVFPNLVVISNEYYKIVIHDYEVADLIKKLERVKVYSKT